MRTPDEVAAMLRLVASGRADRRIARQFGCSRQTVRRYLAARGYVIPDAAADEEARLGKRVVWGAVTPASLQCRRRAPGSRMQEAAQNSGVEALYVQMLAVIESRILKMASLFVRDRLFECCWADRDK
jgi:predicted transcriptional regulator